MIFFNLHIRNIWATENFSEKKPNPLLVREWNFRGSPKDQVSKIAFQLVHLLG